MENKTDRTMKFTSKQDKVLDDLAYTTDTITSIAEKNGISRQSIYAWRKKPDFMEELERRTEGITKMTEEMFKKNLESVHDKLFDIINNSDDERVVLDAIKYYLNRGLGTPTNRIDTDGTLEVKSKVKSGDVLAAFEEMDNKKE